MPEVPPLPVPGDQQVPAQAAKEEKILRMNMHPPPQDTTLKQRSCHHPNTTRAGTNAYQTKITCKDCGFILHLMKKDPTKPMQTQDR